MNSPTALYTVRWLIRDTFRQAMASGLFWLMLAVTGICILLCLSISVENAPDYTDHDNRGLPPQYVNEAIGASASTVADGFGQATGVWPVPRPIYSHGYDQVRKAIKENVPLQQGRMTLAFGAIGPIPLARDAAYVVRMVQFHLAGWVADAAGLLLALIWTAGFLPTFLDPNASSVLLAKPIPRWSLLVGKCVGVMVFVGFQAFVFIFGTWLALAVKTQVWDAVYLLAIPLLLLHFAVFFGFSAMLATLTRSTVACVIGSLLFWFLCWGMNYGRHYALLTPELQNLSPIFAFTMETGYWVLPKPLDFHFILTDTLGSQEFFGRVVDLSKLSSVGGWLPGASLLASAATGIVLFSIAAYDFLWTDY